MSDYMTEVEVLRIAAIAAIISILNEQSDDPLKQVDLLVYRGHKIIEE